MKEAGLHNLAWQNTKHSVHIALHLMNTIGVEI